MLYIAIFYCLATSDKLLATIAKVAQKGSFSVDDISKNDGLSKTFCSQLYVLLSQF